MIHLDLRTLRQWELCLHVLFVQRTIKSKMFGGQMDVTAVASPFAYRSRPFFQEGAKITFLWAYNQHHGKLADVLLYIYLQAATLACVYTCEPYGMCPQYAPLPFNWLIKSFLVACFYKQRLLQSPCDGQLEVNRTWEKMWLWNVTDAGATLWAAREPLYCCVSHVLGVLQGLCPQGKH